LRRTNGGLTALPHGNIVRLHATIRQRTIARKIRLAGKIREAVAGFAATLCKK
jgi:hypothetical protein